MLKLLRNAQVKHILTKSKRLEIRAQLESDLLQSKRELAQLTFHMQKTLKDSKLKHNEQTIRERYKKECKQKQDQIHTLTFKLEQLGLLREGIEVDGETVETIVELTVGDKWVDVNRPIEIILKDGIIQDIRESRNEK
ncbi:YlqD family protein [Alkalihalophilus sp. As8PL]|uniref:YlqD family protein n=1 Tax=Alkalihalophilus sp. As8PL TaxID=3237103 RepID=A0AB39BRP3_9BACI